MNIKSPFWAAVLALGTFASAAVAQNTSPTATPQTQGAAPAGVAAGTTAAQAAAATRDASVSGTRSRSIIAARPQTAAPTGGQTGITGVPRFNPGSNAQASTPAAAATSKVVVTGDTNGDGVPDRSLEAGAPLPGVTLQHNSLGVAPGTMIQVRLTQPVESGHVKNGEMVQGSLAAALGKLPAGAPVQLTVVAVARAGEINSYGELSLQVVSVNGEPLLSEVITAEGKEGAKILPDDAPARGTEAIFTPDQPITLPAA